MPDLEPSLYHHYYYYYYYYCYYYYYYRYSNPARHRTSPRAIVSRKNRRKVQKADHRLLS